MWAVWIFGLWSTGKTVQESTYLKYRGSQSVESSEVLEEDNARQLDISTLVSMDYLKIFSKHYLAQQFLDNIFLIQWKYLLQVVGGSGKKKWSFMVKGCNKRAGILLSATRKGDDVWTFEEDPEFVLRGTLCGQLRCRLHLQSSLAFAFLMCCVLWWN